MEEHKELPIYTRQNTQRIVLQLNPSTDPSLEVFKNSLLNAVVSYK